MPRAPRLDTLGALHHVIVRGIERSTIFRDDTDRTDFLDRIRRLFPETGTVHYAWSLLSMHRLLGGYGTTFNHRHHRCGHLFQNRFKSTLVEEESYFLELLRYIHLNPLRAGIVSDLDALTRYPWSGHAVLLGEAPGAPGDLVTHVPQPFGIVTRVTTSPGSLSPGYPLGGASSCK